MASGWHHANVQDSQPRTDAHGGSEPRGAPQMLMCLVVFFPSNYSWGGFFLTLVLGGKNISKK